ncbi:hypothetical protein [Arthrobacter sp. ISL-65]|uniref:hypothetical protein n=1 Tax=Arthrobacter sp. ISL-65 TaxID=2819112 RepID=UPI001BE54241|nr:hypothetical protein [Arthrobacter sp. ISL-65]MBT2548935.1 hypothetical protein [Arthrobacter sp. ISL-65]
MSIFPGDHLSLERAGRADLGAALITSAVKNPLFGDSSAFAMHYYFRDADPGERLKPRPTWGGSDVIYYSPGMVSKSVQVEVRQSFDRFDEARWVAWTDAAGKVANLPIFAVPGPKQAAIKAVIFAAESAVKVILRSVDRWIDGEKDWVATANLYVAEPGAFTSRAGYLLFYGDDQDEQPTVPGPAGRIIGKEFRIRNQQYKVDEHDRTLRYKDQPDRRVLEGEPYVLALLNGAKEPELKQWAPTAVTALLAERFLNLDEDGSKDFVGILEAYNDIVMARTIANFDDDLADDSLDATTRKELEARRSGALKNIQDSQIKDILSPKK